jgi:histone deacetylase 6
MTLRYILVSAGFDAAEGDELGECNVTPTGYAHMTAMLCTLAEGRVLVALEVRRLRQGRFGHG